MVRTYISKSVTKKMLWKFITRKPTLAVTACVERNMSIWKAAVQFDVKRSKLNDHVKKESEDGCSQTVK